MNHPSGACHNLSIHLPLSCLTTRPMQPHRWCHLQACPALPGYCGSCAWNLFAGPVTILHSCGIMGVVAVVSSSSAQHHSCCGCRLYCIPAHRNTVSALGIERGKNDDDSDISLHHHWSPPRSPLSLSFLLSPSLPWCGQLILLLQHLVSPSCHRGSWSWSVQVCFYIIMN